MVILICPELSSEYKNVFWKYITLCIGVISIISALVRGMPRKSISYEYIILTLILTCDLVISDQVVIHILQNDVEIRCRGVNFWAQFFGVR